MIFGICMAKNEEDVIGPVVRHMLEEVDHVIVADNLSMDTTFVQLQSIKSPNFTLLVDDDPAYKQSEKMTHMAMVARNMGATKVIPFDADEWWRSKHGRLADVLADSPADIHIAPMYNHVMTWASAYPLIINDNLPRTIPWRFPQKNKLHKVACRTSDSLVIAMGNHDAQYRNSAARYDNEDLIEVRHFPYRSAEQFVRKAINGSLALSLTDLPYTMGQHWRDYAALAEANGEDALKEVFYEYFYSYTPEKDGLVYDPV